VPEEELVPVTTYVPRSRVAAFQLHVAQWVSTDPEALPAPARSETGRPPSDQRPDWGADELEVARLLNKKLAVDSVARRALGYLADRPGSPMSPGALAVALDLATDEDDLTGRRQVAGCWGHVGRYCAAAGDTPLPFQWNEEHGYWVTQPTAEILKQAGF
jgi:hypothetical protein